MTDFDDDDVLVGPQVREAFEEGPRYSPAARRFMSGEMSRAEAVARGYLRDRPDDDRPPDLPPDAA